MVRTPAWAARVIASGVRYRRPDIPNLPDFEGAGVSYWATYVEAKLCEGEEVALVGGEGHGGHHQEVVDGRPRSEHGVEPTQRQPLLEGHHRGRSVTVGRLRPAQGRERHRGLRNGAQAVGVHDLHRQLRQLPAAAVGAPLGLDQRLGPEAHHPDDRRSPLVLGRPG